MNMASNADSNREMPSFVESSPENRTLKRSIVALCILSVGTQLFTEISTSFFSTIIHSAGLNFVWAGVINAVYLVLGIVFAIMFGAISDDMRTRFGRRRPLILIGITTTAVLVSLFVNSTTFLWLFLYGGVFMAIANSMTRVSGSLTADVLPHEKRGRINTLLTVMTPIGSVIVWIPSLISVGNSGNYSNEPIVIEAGAAIYAVIGLVVFLLAKEPQVLAPPQGWMHSLAKVLNVQELRRQKNFMKLFFANFFVAAADNAIFLYLFNFVGSIFNNIDIMQIAIFGPIAGAIIGVTIYFLGKAIDKTGRRLITVLGFIVAPFGSWMIAFGGNIVPVLMFGFAIFFPFYWAGTTAVAAWSQDIVPKEARGKLFGFIGITSALGSGLGGIVAGAIADKFGILWIFVASALFLWASLPIYKLVPETVVRTKKQKSTPLAEKSIEPQ